MGAQPAPTVGRDSGGSEDECMADGRALAGARANDRQSVLALAVAAPPVPTVGHDPGVARNCAELQTVGRSRRVAARRAGRRSGGCSSNEAL